MSRAESDAYAFCPCCHRIAAVDKSIETPRLQCECGTLFDVPTGAEAEAARAASLERLRQSLVVERPGGERFRAPGLFTVLAWLEQGRIGAADRVAIGDDAPAMPLCVHAATACLFDTGSDLSVADRLVLESAAVPVGRLLYDGRAKLLTEAGQACAADGFPGVARARPVEAEALIEAFRSEFDSLRDELTGASPPDGVPDPTPHGIIETVEIPAASGQEDELEGEAGPVAADQLDLTELAKPLLFERQAVEVNVTDLAPTPPPTPAPTEAAEPAFPPPLTELGPDRDEAPAEPVPLASVPSPDIEELPLISPDILAGDSTPTRPAEDDLPVAEPVAEPASGEVAVDFSDLADFTPGDAAAPARDEAKPAKPAKAGGPASEVVELEERDLFDDDDLEDVTP